MTLKFDLQKDGKSKSIVNVTVDNDGNILTMSCTDPVLEMGLLKEAGPSSFKALVKCTVSGKICSDQIDVLYNRRWTYYKAVQMA